MNGKITTREEIDYIVTAYKEGVRVKAIAADIGKCEQTVWNVLDKEGVRKIERRITGKTTKSTMSDVKCPNCRATGHYKGAKFCYKCGADIRTEADILRERLGKLTADMQYLPDSIRDSAYRVIQDTIDYLRKV